jgi:hypothetical protein
MQKLVNTGVKLDAGLHQRQPHGRLVWLPGVQGGDEHGAANGRHRVAAAQPAPARHALQPGTVRSRLSKPFEPNVEHLLEPDESVAGLMQVMQSLPSKTGAHFNDYLGQEIPW